MVHFGSLDFQFHSINKLCILLPAPTAWIKYGVPEMVSLPDNSFPPLGPEHSPLYSLSFPYLVVLRISFFCSSLLYFLVSVSFLFSFHFSFIIYPSCFLFSLWFPGPSQLKFGLSRFRFSLCLPSLCSLSAPFNPCCFSVPASFVFLIFAYFNFSLLLFSYFFLTLIFFLSHFSFFFQFPFLF